MIEILQKNLSKDGSKKYLFRALDEEKCVFEAIAFKRHADKLSKYTICISSQSGCKMGCQFCATAHIGFKRNLTFDEMKNTIVLILLDLNISYEDLNYVAFMGMGEPLDNFNTVVQLIGFLYDAGVKNISLSTIGFPNKIVDLSKTANPPDLFVSLHFLTEKLRNKYMPSTSKFTIEEIDKACKTYFHNTNGRCKVNLSYLLIRDINDSLEDAKLIGEFFDQNIYKINLLTYNDNEYSNFSSPSLETVELFRNTLENCGFEITYRPSQGTDVLGGCGQMGGNYIVGRG